ncbi:UDP-glycosyltransferase 75C1-like [Tasmannia lanceolata]|uniref:UDP-glycosyltransferase 75C1-like n=1 Tax=Tasmannia lanceolata TaxID=3420 RepID=UPI0040643A45
MEESPPPPHFLLVTFPAQGHINPALQFAKRLVHTDAARVTFTTTVYAQNHILKSSHPIHHLLSYASFSDGFDEGVKPSDDPNQIMAQFKDLGSKNITHLVRTLADQGQPVTCIIYTILLPWVADVAFNLQIPSRLLWIQPASVFAIYYHYYHGLDHLIKTQLNENPSLVIDLPKLPLLIPQDLPSFLLPSSPDSHSFISSKFKELFEVLDKKETKPQAVLVNTFDALEVEALRAVDGFDLIGIGPLIPSAFLDRKDTNDTTFGGDLLKGTSTDYIKWLDSKPALSVVYVAFGSFSVLPKHQMEEILRGLLESRRPFLWVIRMPENGLETETETEFLMRVKEDEEGGGLVVPWCSQVEVLSHPSVGCFVTHCGWNSMSESLAIGVPMVGFPQWTDQPTNAKLVEDVWKTGVRARVNKDGVLEGEELKRCLDMVMGGETGEEMKKNAWKWRDLAREATREGGSSHKNIWDFVEEVREGNCL